MTKITRTITLAFETEEQARCFDEALRCETADLPDHGLDRSHPADWTMDLGLAIEVLATRAVKARTNDSDPGRVEVQFDD